MKIAFYSSKPYDQASFAEHQDDVFSITYLPTRLTEDTTQLANGHDAVCLFVNDSANESTLQSLYDNGCRIIALRCAGYNNVDIKAAERIGITVVRVPAYSPQAVAEHAVALILSLNRKTHRAYNRVREGNFELDGLLGFDLFKKKIGVIGTGQIGRAFIQIMEGFGCSILACDPQPSDQLPSSLYTDMDTILRESDIISLHCPLNEATHHLLDDVAFSKTKPEAMVINTGRGALIETGSAICALKARRIGYLGIDVYEEERSLFFEDHSMDIISDDQIIRLMSFPNVMITGHQGFFTKEALSEIAAVTCASLKSFSEQKVIDSTCLLTHPEIN